MKHVEIKFNSDNTNECRKLVLNDEYIAEAVAKLEYRKKYINTNVLFTSFNGSFKVGGSWNHPCVIVEAGTSIRLDVANIEALKEELKDFKNDDIELIVKDFTEDEEKMIKEIEIAKEETEKIKRETEQIQKLLEKFLHARAEREKAAEKLAETLEKLNREEEILETVKVEQKEIEEKGINGLFTVKEMKQDSGRTHYFVIFTKEFTRETYNKLAAFAYLNNGRYRSTNGEKGFYFKSLKSKDNFMAIKDFNIAAQLQEKIDSAYKHQLCALYAK